MQGMKSSHHGVIRITVRILGPQCPHQGDILGSSQDTWDTYMGLQGPHMDHFKDTSPYHPIRYPILDPPHAWCSGHGLWYYRTSLES